MVLTDVIKMGNRIEIRSQQDENLMEDMGRNTAVCYSSVEEIISNKELSISMPMQGQRMVLFPTGADCDMTFFGIGGMYRCTATVKGRSKEGQFYFLNVVLKSELRKYQRREYFRIEYMSQITFYLIPKKVAELPTTDHLLEEIANGEVSYELGAGTIQDISGGGIRFHSERKLERDIYLMITLRLERAWMKETLYLVSQIVDCVPHASMQGQFSCRGKFLYKDLRDREKIVRFVFEEERRIRQKENGE